MLLHVFTPQHKDIVVDNENVSNIVLGQNNIKRVREIKFLGVIRNVQNSKA